MFKSVYKHVTNILQSSVGTLEAHFWVQMPPKKSPRNLKVRRPFSKCVFNKALVCVVY
jgi:hypothetical protein